ncbi:MAG: TAXI family TRAP transporter solute-binding subunit [Alphaproteobacteria bacterium]|nr:TAXI family TRAP transporter solute-binding subunit [Alphaproteobacteria bacterium]
MGSRSGIAAALVAALALAAPSPPAVAQERYLVFGGGSTGGLFFIVAAGMARVVEKNVPGLRVTAQVTSGAVENVRLMGTSKVDCALGSADSAFHAANQSGPFAKERYTNIRYVTRGYTSAFHNIVLPDSPIRALGDIKGKRVGILIGITAQDWFPAVAQVYGMTQGKDFRVSVLRATELVNALRDGNVDMAVYMGGAPTSTITDIATSRGVKFVPIDAREGDDLIRTHPYFSRGVLEKGTYPGIAEDVPTIRVPNLFMCREDVPEAVVYGITRTLMEKEDELRQIHPEAAAFGLANAGKSVIIPVHPGAERYYREKGIKLGS